MTRDKIESFAESVEEEIVLLDPPEVFDDAILGIVETAEMTLAVAYDIVRIIDALVLHHGMSREEAEEWFEFNTRRGVLHLGAPPVFVDTRYAE